MGQPYYRGIRESKGWWSIGAGVSGLVQFAGLALMIGRVTSGQEVPASKVNNLTVVPTAMPGGGGLGGD